MEKVEKARVLLIEDDAIWARYTAELIGDIADVDYEVVIAESYPAAVERMKQGGFDVCLVDIRLGAESGIDLIYEAARYLPLTPAVLVTGLDQNPALEEEAVDAGATDLIYKDELDTRSMRRVLHMALLRREANRRLQEEAILDDMTGLYNRTHFETCLGVEWQRSARTAEPLSLMLIDLDEFKSVNDNYSHQVGDLLLQAVSAQMKILVRKTDVPARLSGDEFAVLLPNTDLAQAKAAGEKILQGVSGIKLDCYDEISVSASIGCSSTAQGHLTAFALMRAADGASYAAKAAGKNQVREWTPELRQSDKTA